MTGDGCLRSNDGVIPFAPLPLTFPTQKPEEPPKSADKRKCGRPETRVIKINATPEEIARAIFPAAEPLDPTRRIKTEARAE